MACEEAETRMFAIGSALRRSAATIALAALAACTTYVLLSDSYRGPDAWPTDGSIVYQELTTEPLDVAAEADVEARIRARFVVRQVSLPSASDFAEPIEFESYDVDVDGATAGGG